MNGGVSKRPARRSRANLPKACQDALLNVVADTGAELPQNRLIQPPVNGALARDVTAVPATKRKLDPASEDPLPAKRARLAQVEAQQPGTGDEKSEQAVKTTLQQPKPTPPPGQYPSFLKDFVDPPPPESIHATVFEWLASVVPERCRSDSCLQSSADDPIARNLARSAPEMSYTRHPDGFAVPPTPVSAGSLSYPIDADTRSVAASDVTGSGRSSGRSLVEDPRYRDMNLAANNVYFDHPCDPIPGHITTLVDYVRRDRDSPGPSPEEVRQNRDLYDLSVMGVEEAEVEAYFHTNIFPAPKSSHSLKRSVRQPMARHTVPSTGSALKVSNPVPDLLYGYNRHMAFPNQQSQLISMGTEMVANSPGLLYPFFVIEFKGEGGNMWVATNQCLGGSASCVKVAERLNHQLHQCKSSKIRQVDSAAFSIAMNGSEARLYISWKQNELNYYMADVKSFCLREPDHYIEFRKYVRNIIDWGKDKRLNQIRDSLDSLLEENRKRTSQAAKSRLPPSDGSATSSGKKPRSSLSRKKSSRSSSAKGQSRGTNETDWGLDKTASQDIYEEASSCPDQQESFVEADNYAASQDINEESVLPSYPCLDDDQPGESQLIELFGSAEARASFATSFTSSFTSSFGSHCPLPPSP
ncbi:hypothetical protein F5Y17DRAFT_452771 [Xylariaceae sp. FL0594]|nr:hypothetical protein F5Y17DRAFT_452771 [Xylariaceae sp. FL0594]